MDIRCFVLMLLAVASLATEGPADAITFSEPFAYCAAVDTIDAPGAGYVGPPMPESIARGLHKALTLPPDAPLEPLLHNSFWRCMDGRVYACTVGANLACMAKANASRSPTPAQADFCKANPQAEFIPMAVSGRETIYEWRCRKGVPRIVRALTTPDARGFLSNLWYRLTPP
jgi:hypothetical protein